MAITSIFPSGNSGKKINDATITLVQSNFVYDGIKKTQQVSSVVLNGTTLTQNTDYVIVGNRATNAGTYMLSVLGAGRYSGTASSSWSIAKAQGSIEVDTNSMTIQGEGTEETAEFSVVGDGAVTVDSSDSSVAVARIEENRVYVECVGSGEANITIVLGEGNNYLGASCQIAVTCSLAHIYGVSWDGTSTTAWTRTDDAADFTDPVPAIGNGSGSSPFDNILPWSGMVKETIDGNVMVKIPKFWYKWTDESGSLKLQIADSPLDGFHVSPAHADRGDDKGERDYVYVGRYHCNSSYKSVTAGSPLGNITRATARSSCRGVGAGYSQLDYAMLWTIRMLYLVEYADWDAQKVIGYGCSPSGSKFTMGYTDSMAYHTGTDTASRAFYGGTQYRYIEGLWDNVKDWCDGIVLSSKAAYVTNVVANYGDSTSNHVKVSNGPSSNGEITGWAIPTTSGLEWALFPNTTTSNGNYDTYVADYVYAGYAVVYVGGNYNQNRVNGMFYTDSVTPSTSSADIGSRLMKLP